MLIFTSIISEGTIRYMCATLYTKVFINGDKPTQGNISKLRQVHRVKYLAIKNQDQCWRKSSWYNGRVWDYSASVFSM